MINDDSLWTSPSHSELGEILHFLSDNLDSPFIRGVELQHSVSEQLWAAGDKKQAHNTNYTLSNNRLYADRLHCTMLDDNPQCISVLISLKIHITLSILETFLGKKVAV